MQPPAGSQVSRVPAQRPPSEQLPPAPAAPAPERPRRRVRTVLTVVAGVLALLCLGGAVTGYVLYDRATAPDRSAPDVVVDNYLRAFLVDRNDVRADQFICQAGHPEQLRALRDELTERQAQFGVPIAVSWGSLEVRRQDDRAQVEVVLTISAVVDGTTQSDRQSWQLSTQLHDDWRVCDATALG
ncbi:hypothetical protein [Micromonospora avicenniae]|uniref:Uncharacterized protein n=1 Tax=Micromonospora avicenniae TaxID=1198245 RepID=A0A1N6R337_9ACTN|nr:hypothetical protein [Micromonospora avicenniae]SIQ23330.1 hypothetical protein SAMN05444858_101584 [Micromonospora avicenniae]